MKMRTVFIRLIGLAAAGATGVSFAAAATHYNIVVPNVPWYVSFQVSATALDGSNTIDTSYNGTAVETSSDPIFVNVGPVTFANGAANINVAFKTAGVQTLTFTDTNNPSITGTATFTVPHGPANRIFVAAPGSVTPGVPFNFTITMQDLVSNIVTDYSGTVHFTSSDGAAVLPADSILTNGVGTFSATFNTKPTETITATDTQNPAVTGTSAPITTPVRLQDFHVD
jgi:hypothetical protein